MTSRRNELFNSYSANTSRFQRLCRQKKETSHSLKSFFCSYHVYLWVVFFALNFSSSYTVLVYLGSEADFHILSFDGAVQDNRCHQKLVEDWCNYDIVVRVPKPQDVVHADQSVHGVKLPFTEMIKNFLY